jgi:MoxR-like ATPase
MNRTDSKREPTSPSLPADPVEAVAFASSRKREILAAMAQVIIGHERVIDEILTALFAHGHCLLLGVPGLAKTLMVKTLAQTMSLDFQRIQFTPDLMPADITGTNILEQEEGTVKRGFRFQRGPVFTNVLLADEINRTPPKTQAALLEAMQEMQVTAAGQCLDLPRPFLVLATQNPIEQEGTYPLPEAQLDRFFFTVKVDYQSEAEELRIIKETTTRREAAVDAVLEGGTIREIQELVRTVPVSDHVAGYAARLMRATRPQFPQAPEFIKTWLHYGCGPRAGQCLLLAAKAAAVLNGRTDVACEDIRAYAYPTLRHRLILNFAAVSEGVDADEIIRQLLETVPE